MHNNAYDQAVKRLSALDSLRVWSLLVSVFGDLAPACSLDGPTLSTIMEAVGTKPEATRVALYRLRSDDWIASKKNGRTSLHRLTHKGQRDSAAAHQRIYGTPDQMGLGAQVFLVSHINATPDPALYAQISAQTYIASTETPLPEGAMQLKPIDFPKWLGPQIESKPLKDAYADLHAVLTDIDKDLPGGTALSPLEIAVMRVMIVHAWRRLALKHPDLPRAAHSEDWRGHDCRSFVTSLLGRFPRPALDQIKAT